MSKRALTAIKTSAAGLLAALLALAWLRTRTLSVREFVIVLAAASVFIWAICSLTAGLRIRESILRLFLVCTACAFSAAAIELLALAGLVDFRVLFGTIDGEPWKNPINNLDPDLLHIHKPHIELNGIQHTGDIGFYMHVPERNSYPFEAVYDANGFRNSSDYDQVDVAVIGDSFIEAATVSQSEMLTSVLADLLQSKVANLGQLWYGPQQELAVLKRYALGLKPKVIVWAFFAGNDISDYRRYQEAHANWDQISPGFHSFRQRIFTKNAILAGYRLLARAPQKEPAPYCDLIDSAKRMYFYYPATPLEGLDLETFPHVLNTIQQAYSAAQSSQIDFVVAYVPTKYEVYSELCIPGTNVGLDSWSGRELASKLERGLSDISKQIKFVNLTVDLKSAAAQGRAVYFTDDTHWTAEGNAVSARAISQALEAKLLQ